jgi:hypothetical protein
VVIWYIFSVLVSLDQEKSGNPSRKGFSLFSCEDDEGTPIKVIAYGHHGDAAPWLPDGLFSSQKSQFG